jgi:hypothetical protein
MDGSAARARRPAMSAPASRRKGAEDAEIVLRMLDDSVGEPMDPASRYAGRPGQLDSVFKTGFCRPSLGAIASLWSPPMASCRALCNRLPPVCWKPRSASNSAGGIHSGA